MTHARTTRGGLAFGGGLSTDDEPLVEDTLRQFLDRLERMATPHEAELSIRDRDKRGMKTTLEVWVRGLPKIVVTSDEPEVRDALNEVGERALLRLDTVLRRRRPLRERVRNFRRAHDRRAARQAAAG